MREKVKGCSTHGEPKRVHPRVLLLRLAFDHVPTSRKIVAPWPWPCTTNVYIHMMTNTCCEASSANRNLYRENAHKLNNKAAPLLVNGLSSFFFSLFFSFILFHFFQLFIQILQDDYIIFLSSLKLHYIKCIIHPVTWVNGVVFLARDLLIESFRGLCRARDNFD